MLRIYIVEEFISVLNNAWKIGFSFFVFLGFRDRLSLCSIEAKIGFSCEEETISLSWNSHKINLDIRSEKMTHTLCRPRSPSSSWRPLSVLCDCTNCQNFSVAGIQICYTRLRHKYGIFILLTIPQSGHPRLTLSPAADFLQEHLSSAHLYLLGSWHPSIDPECPYFLNTPLNLSFYKVSHPL